MTKAGDTAISRLGAAPFTRAEARAWVNQHCTLSSMIAFGAAFGDASNVDALEECLEMFRPEDRPSVLVRVREILALWGATSHWDRVR